MDPVIISYYRDGAYRTPWVVTIDGKAHSRHRTIGRARSAARRLVGFYRGHRIPVKLVIRKLNLLRKLKLLRR